MGVAVLAGLGGLLFRQSTRRKKANAELKQANASLAETNTALGEANAALAEANRVKARFSASSLMIYVGRLHICCTFSRTRKRRPICWKKNAGNYIDARSRHRRKIDDANVLSIRDNGPGIGANDARTLYEEPVVENARDGFGLHIIRDFATAIHCCVEVRTEPGKETEFLLILPAVERKNLQGLAGGFSEKNWI